MRIRSWAQEPNWSPSFQKRRGQARCWEKNSYTLNSRLDGTGNHTVKLEVNLRAKHFRVQKKNADAPTEIVPPNLPWSKHGGPLEAWEEAKRISGFDPQQR